mgnify:CR=1
TATTEIYTLSLHDALPICPAKLQHCSFVFIAQETKQRSEEHTSELQSRMYLV